MNCPSQINTVIRNADDTTTLVTLERMTGGMWRVVAEKTIRNVRRTACRNGHPIEFTRWDKHGQARCRLCRAERRWRSIGRGMRGAVVCEVGGAGEKLGVDKHPE